MRERRGGKVETKEEALGLGAVWYADLIEELSTILGNDSCPFYNARTLSIDQASILPAIAFDGNKIAFKVNNVTHDRREK
jgi:hypothetical protein